jgi:signal transduction histidine kinase
LRGETTRLDEQLAALIQTHRDRHRTNVDFRLEGEPSALTPEVGVALIRTAQEALVNTAKHAPHQPVEVNLAYRPDEVTLTIANSLDSRDVSEPVEDPSTAYSTANGGYGLIGMRERLLLIHGSLTTGSEDPTRWTVFAQVPR